MADGIISSLSHLPVVFHKKYPDDLIFPHDFEYYDLIYIMIPGYIKTVYKPYYHKIVSTFHGGPGTEGQASDIIAKEKDIKWYSYVSTEVKNRVNESTGNAFENLVFTPHGVDIVKFSDNIVKKMVFGFAGHASYLLPSHTQSKHRRGYWITRVWDKLRFDLRVAGGMVEYPESIKAFTKQYPDINCELYSKEKIQGFYRKIGVYLIPDKHAGGPMPALEAGAMDIPLITTNCGLLDDCFSDEIHGLMIKNYKEFFKAIEWAINNPDEMIKMGKNWGEYVRRNRSWDAVKQY
jgi:glycosyltransferase involved in cell wall biosynthesis